MMDPRDVMLWAIAVILVLAAGWVAGAIVISFINAFEELEDRISQWRRHRKER